MFELHFIPDGRDQPVVAVDSVDIGSAPPLTIGSRVAVRYNAGNPRDARLPGTRTYRWREWLELAQYLALIAVMFGGLVLLSRLAGIWWMRITRRP